jgi:hypothetical protein
MKKMRVIWRKNANLILIALLVGLGLGAILLYKLGSLVSGLSAGEVVTATSPVGWHGIFHQPFDLALKLIRSVVFFFAPEHGQTLTRLPNAMFGGLTIISFAWLVWLWHGTRTAALSTLLFATSAWTLHVSRLASFDVLYLWAIPTLLLVQVVLHRYGDKSIAWYGSLLTWGLLLYIPGMIWLIAAQLYVQRQLIKKTWQNYKSSSSLLLSAAAIVIWLPLLIINLTRDGQLAQWLGLPSHFPGVFHLVKQFFAVFVHLFLRGPKYPELWLDKVPILDVLTLVTAGLGVYFYSRNWRATRSQTLGLFFIVGVILVTLGGPVSISLLVALTYVFAAAGIAYLLREWLKVFPNNPLARGLGIGLVTLAVALSCTYNLRSYFVAWPHNATTKSTFRYHR